MADMVDPLTDTSRWTSTPMPTEDLRDMLARLGIEDDSLRITIAPADHG